MMVCAGIAGAQSTPAKQAAASEDLTALSLEDLMNVEVTSVSKNRQRVADAPAAVTVISQDDIQRSGLRQIPEILRMAPGLFVQRGTTNQWTIASRGLAYDFNNNLLVLQDGRSVYYPVNGSVNWSTIDYPVADLERIEVIRGPGATLWGANAVNGVINITSKSAEDTQGGLIDTRAGTDDSDLAVRYGGQIDGQTFYRVYMKGLHLNDLHVDPHHFDANYGLDSGVSGFRIDRRSSDRDHFTLQGDVYSVSSEDPQSRPLYVPPFTRPAQQNQKFDGGNVLARWTHTVSSKSNYTLQAYVDHANTDLESMSYRISTIDIDFQHRLPLMANHDLIYGVNGRIQPFHSEAAGDGLSLDSPLGISWTPSENLYLLSAFIQDTITLVPDRVKFTLGTKVEYNSLTQWEFEPSARLLWTPNNRHSAWAAVSRAVRTPGQDNRTFFLPVAVFPNGGGTLTQINFAGSDDTESESLVAYELGYRSQITSAWSIDVAGFLNNHKGLLVAQSQTPVFVPTPVPHVNITSIDVNGADLRNYGVELASTLHINERWRIRGSYSLLISDIVSSDPGVTFNGTFYDAPRNQFQLHSALNITQNLQFNTALYYVDSVQNGQIPSYARLDANLTWTPRSGMAVQVGIQNALDPEHPEFVPRSGPQSEIETAIYGQLTWQF
jgi:iron complex outermembrane recepter protein